MNKLSVSALVSGTVLAGITGSCAMSLLQAGIDTAVIALWLGHADIRSTGIYLHTDLTIKQRALDAMTSPSTKPGRYRPRDKLLASLEGL